MDKKKYLTPQMEVEEVKMVTFMQSYSGGDPTINPTWGGNNKPDIEWPDDED